MNNHFFRNLGMILGLYPLALIAEGQTGLMAEELNAPPPPWLSLGAPIKATPSRSLSGSDATFRPRSGGATNSSNRVQIPSLEIEIKLDYDIDWTGNKEAGTAVSLSPSGTRLIVNSGPKTRAYEILADKTYREIPLELPHVTYDDSPKGYLYSWSWADDETLVARAEITDEAVHRIVENRIYVFHLQPSILSRLDLSELKLKNTEMIEVIGISEDLSHLKLAVDDAVVITRADLKALPRIQKRDAHQPIEAPQPTKPSQLRSKQPKTEPADKPNELMTTPILWSIIIALILAVCFSFWFRRYNNFS